MAIKLDRPIEKFLHNLDNLPKKNGPSAEKERIKKLEEARQSVINEIVQLENIAPATIGPVAAVSAPQARQQKKIESILSSGLEEIYLSLAPARKEKFKMVGEETAAKINKILAKTKINISAIIRLIRKWFSLIPGVNKYFLEQEAKIRAEKIVKIKNENIKM